MKRKHIYLDSPQGIGPLPVAPYSTPHARASAHLSHGEVSPAGIGPHDTAPQAVAAVPQNEHVQHHALGDHAVRPVPQGTRPWRGPEGWTRGSATLHGGSATMHPGRELANDPVGLAYQAAQEYLEEGREALERWMPALSAGPLPRAVRTDVGSEDLQSLVRLATDAMQKLSRSLEAVGEGAPREAAARAPSWTTGQRQAQREHEPSLSQRFLSGGGHPARRRGDEESSGEPPRAKTGRGQIADEDLRKADAGHGPGRAGSSWVRLAR